MSTTDYDRVLREAERLPPDQQRALIERLTDRLRGSEEHEEEEKERPRWEDFEGTAPYPLCGEDAQGWVSRTRREADEGRRIR
jgi:hypothetical protein